MTKQLEAIMTFEVLYMNFKAGHSVNFDWITTMTNLSDDRTAEIISQLQAKNYVGITYQDGQEYFFATLTGARAFVAKGFDKPQTKLQYAK